LEQYTFKQHGFGGKFQKLNMAHQLIFYLWVSFPKINLLALQVHIFVGDIILTVEMAQPHDS
jgi:hypothetical protein